MLSPRKEKILKSVVDKYISTASPVSSKELLEAGNFELSSATIRNELAALEEMGYLLQPHTSSGRIPTPEAYKLYVNKLMPKRKLSRAELSIIKKYFSKTAGEIEDILKKTAQVISEVTNYTSVAFLGNARNAVIENIRFIKLYEKAALVIVVTDLGIIKDTVMELEKDFSEEYFDAAARTILNVFYQRPISEALKPKKLIREAVGKYKAFFDYVLKMLENHFSEGDGDGGDIVMSGSSKILQYPEYSDVAKAKAMMNLLESREKLMPLLKSAEEMNINIQIGHGENGENGGNVLKDTAIITTHYSINGKSVGNAGVIGPIRMDYPLVISVLDTIGKMLGTVQKGALPEMAEGTEEGEESET